jgi:CAAX protease family protein
MTDGPLAPASAARDYWLPLVVFGVFTTLEQYVTHGWYPWVFLTKIVAVTAVLLRWRAGLREIRPTASVVLPAWIVGVLIVVEWLVIDAVVPYPHLGSRVGFDPIASIPDRARFTAFLAGRLYGLVILVPVIEEIFWRDFVLRYLTNQNFQSVPIGTFSQRSLWMMAIGSALTHSEWVVALLAALFFAWVVRSTKSLFAAVVAHSVANGALAAYILVTRDWKYW